MLVMRQRTCSSDAVRVRVCLSCASARVVMRVSGCAYHAPACVQLLRGARERVCLSCASVVCAYQLPDADEREQGWKPLGRAGG